MKVTLVGTNMEIGEIRRALEEGDRSALLSPEPIAAAYARVSRSPRSVEELRRQARENVEKARRSNSSIVFEMGHSSIAEHAVFNFDVEGISRLVLEELELSRLASYTERSQRYVLLGRDYVVPPEVGSVPEWGERFQRCVERLFAAYADLHDRLLSWHREEAGNGRETGSGRQIRLSQADISAREDARYVLPLAAAGQVGVTLNARSLGGMVRRLRGSALAEARQLAELLEREALAVAPSLVRHTEPTRADRLLRERLMPMVLPEVRQPHGSPSGRRGAAFAGRSGGKGGAVEDGPVRVELLHVTPGGEELLGRAAALAAGRGPEAEDPAGEAGGLCREYYSCATEHQPAPRLFELVDLVFRVTCSASCFGQLKRHRMATLLPGPYDVGLGVCVPPALSEAGLEGLFRDAAGEAEALYRDLAAGGCPAAACVLTNAHRRQVVFKADLRELYHVSRLRMDGHAQWEIRDVAGRMCALAATALPGAGAYLCGKDGFARLVSRGRSSRRS